VLAQSTFVCPTGAAPWCTSVQASGRCIHGSHEVCQLRVVKMLWPWGWWETCSSTQACLIIFILGGLHQRGASRVRIHRIQTTLVARQREYFWIFWMVFCVFLISLTPLAGPILCGGNLSPNLHARFCKLYPADFSVAIYLFLCS